MLTVAVACCGPASARERPTTTPVARVLQTTIATAFDLVRTPATPATNAGLATLMDDAMDWPGLTQFAIGRYRADLGDDAMDDVKARLEQRLAVLARRAGDELGTLTLAIRDLRIDPDGDRHVLSTATLRHFGEIDVEWTLVRVQTGAEGSGYRIADIAAFGLTLREFLRGWITALIADQGGDPSAVSGPSP